MTLSNSERFRRFLQLDTTIDRTPVIEWAGWWDKTIARWQEEDLPVIDDYADGINDYWGQDLLHQYWCPIRGAGMPGAAYHGGPIILDEKDYEKVRPFLFTDEVLEELRQSKMCIRDRISQIHRLSALMPLHQPAVQFPVEIGGEFLRRQLGRHFADIVRIEQQQPQQRFLRADCPGMGGGVGIGLFDSILRIAHDLRQLM